MDPIICIIFIGLLFNTKKELHTVTVKRFHTLVVNILIWKTVSFSSWIRRLHRTLEQDQQTLNEAYLFAGPTHESLLTITSWWRVFSSCPPSVCMNRFTYYMCRLNHTNHTIRSGLQDAITECFELDLSMNRNRRYNFDLKIKSQGPYSWIVW